MTPLDRPTIEAHLKRALENHTQLEKMLSEKQAQATQAATEAERMRGALEYSGIVLNAYRRDLEILDTAAKAAAEAAERSKQPPVTT